jgi:hypothetical protein
MTGDGFVDELIGQAKQRWDAYSHLIGIRIARLAADDHARLADLLAHLAEVDARRLYVGLSFASLFTYCVQAL